MDIELRVIVFITAIVCVIQLAVLYFQYNTFKKYEGFGWWLFWTASELAGMIVFIVKSYGDLNKSLTILQHFFIVAGLIFLHIGVIKFTGQNVKWKLIFGVIVVYLLVLLYSIFENNLLSYRIELLNVTMVLILVYSAIKLLKFRMQHFSSSAIFLSITFLFVALLSVVIVIMNLSVKGDNIFYMSILTSKIQFYNLLTGQILWVLGIILMLNQRLNGELQDSMEHFKLIFTLNPEPAIITNIEEGTVFDINKSFTKQYGYKPEDLVGKSTLDLRLWENTDARNKFINKIKENGFCNNLEVVAKHINGSMSTGLISGNIIHINGKPHLLSAIRDITKRKETEETLRESEEKFRKGFENTNTGMCLFGIKGKMIKVNHTMCEIFGYTKEELEAMDFNTLAGNNFDNNEDKLIFGNNDQMQFEKEYIHKNGNKIIAKVSRSLIRDSEGTPLYFISHLIDITKSREAEEKLKASEEKYRLLTENMTDVVWTMDAETLMFTYVSPSVEKLRGFTPKEIMAEPMDAALTPEGAAYVREKMKINIEKFKNDPSGYNDYLVDQVEQPKKDGTMVWTEVVTGLFENKKTGRIEVHGVTRDISERKKWEEEFKMKNEELRKTNAEKDNFFSIIAHDLRSPFNGILGITDIMSNNIEAFTKDEIKKYSKALKMSADNLFKLLNNLLEWSRFQGGMTSFNPVKYNLNAQFTETINLFEETAKQKGIELIDDTTEIIFADADRIMIDTILRNLVSNSIKFTKRGGKVTIGAESSKSRVKIYVRDTGIGMDKELVENLFRLDVKTGRRGTENEEGTALGLILCSEFVEKHGSVLNVKSEVGVGTEFSFELMKKAEET